MHQRDSSYHAATMKDKEREAFETYPLGFMKDKEARAFGCFSSGYCRGQGAGNDEGQGTRSF